ncbi:elongator complex protein 2-like isoform X1 [Palaemon carinicauda]|uniref:elongator complex protein 2-like isoform X1 n=1 Tax=Palaemon carinicauda TaxID=392227 RepID=UPI0035B6287B
MFITSLLPVKIEEAKHPLLLCGDHDSRIHVFTRESLGDYFPEAVLNGHEDWVTLLDIMREDNGGLLLASGSKDSSVRVWKVSVLEKGDDAKDAEDREDKVLRLRSVVFRVKPLLRRQGRDDICVARYYLSWSWRLEIRSALGWSNDQRTQRRCTVVMSDGLVIHEDGKEKLIIVTAATAMAACWIVCPVTGEREGRKTFRLPRRTFITSLLPVKVEEAKHPLLLCGDHDSRIRIFTRESLGDYFPEAVLNGHEDWVTSLDITREDNGGLLLSSGPKDSSVRVWKVWVLEKGDDVKDAEDREHKVLRLRSVVFRVKPSSSSDKDVTISVLLDTILAGHGGLRSEVPWAGPMIKGEREGRKTFCLPRRTFITSLLPVKVEEAKHPLLLCGDHDSRIRVFTRESLGDYFPEAVLNGHEDWVTSLDIMREDNGGLLLASGPKDSSVRFWKVSVLEKEDDAKDAEDREDKVLRLRSVVFRVKPSSSGDKDVTISVLLDTILAGHGGLRSEVPWAGPMIKDVEPRDHKTRQRFKGIS